MSVTPTPSAERFSRLVNDDVLRSLELSTVDVADAKYWPGWLYSSEEWFEYEKAAVYDRSWLCVGRADFLKKPGDYYTVTINDEPLIVVMGDDGEIRVMSAVCQHRGSVLVEDQGCVETGLFRCPLHFWSYDLQGRLRHAPEMNRTHFERSEICLPQLKVELWQGFVFVHFDHDAPPLAPTLTTLEAEMKNYDVENMVSLPPMDVPDYPWNWKVMLENFMEPYHNAYLHKGIHDFALGHGFVDHSPDENVIMHPTGFDRPDAAFNPLHQALLRPIGVAHRRATQPRDVRDDPADDAARPRARPHVLLPHSPERREQDLAAHRAVRATRRVHARELREAHRLDRRRDHDVQRPGRRG